MPHDLPDPSWTSAPNLYGYMGDNTGRLSPYDMAVRSDCRWISMAHLSASERGTRLHLNSDPLTRHTPHYIILIHSTAQAQDRLSSQPNFLQAIINTRRLLSQKAGAVINKNIHLRPDPGSMDIHGMERDWELGRPWHCPSDATQSRSTAIPALYCIFVQGHSVCASSCACVSGMVPRAR